MQEYVQLLKQNRPFRRLWFATVASYMGDWFNLIASAEIITSVTDSGAALSYLFLARMLPFFFLSPVAGVLADRFDRRKLMIFADLSRVFVVLGFLFVKDASDVWLLYALTVLQISLSALFKPAQGAVLSNLVDSKDLVVANAIDSATWSTMLAIGALLGGVATGLFGSQTAFVIDALTFLISAYFLSRVVVPLRPKSKQEVSTEGLFSFLDGLRYLRGVPFILALTLVKAGGSLIWGALNVVEIAFAKEVFPIGEDGAITLGIVYAISGIGTGISPLLLRRWFGDALPSARKAIAFGFGLMTMGIGLIAITPNLSLFLIGTFVRTLGTGALWVFASAMLQQLVPDRFRGRVFAFEFAMLTLAQSISVLWAGWGQDWFGLDARQIALSMTIFSILPLLMWITVDRRWLKSERKVLGESI